MGCFDGVMSTVPFSTQLSNLHESRYWRFRMLGFCKGRSVGRSQVNSYIVVEIFKQCTYWFV